MVPPATKAVLESVRQESVNCGLDYWNGLLDWTTGLTFDLNIIPQNNFFACKACSGKCKIATRHEIGPAKCSRNFKAIEMNL